MFSRAAIDYVTKFAANCTMTGTTVPVVSAEFIVTYTTCSTGANAFALTSSFANPVATYGTDSSVQVVGTTSTSPFTATAGYCPDIECTLINPPKGQALV